MYVFRSSNESTDRNKSNDQRKDRFLSQENESSNLGWKAELLIAMEVVGYLKFRYKRSSYNY